MNSATLFDHLPVSFKAVFVVFVFLVGCVVLAAIAGHWLSADDPKPDDDDADGDINDHDHDDSATGA